MDKFVKFLANVRLGIAEVGGTLSVLGLFVFATYMAWKDFVAPLLLEYEKGLGVIDPFCGAGASHSLEFLKSFQVRNGSAGGTMWQGIVQWWWSVAPYLKTPVPIIISLIALYFSLHDRRPRLTVRARKGDWAKISEKPEKM